MPAPTLKRNNTFGIRYIEGQLKAEHYEEIIEKILKVPEDEVYGIAERGYKFLLKVTTEEKYQDICENLLGEHTVSPGVIIDVSDISSYKTRVSVKDVPFEIDSETLKRIFSCYGSVESVKMQYNYKLKASKYQKTRTDRNTVWMDIEGPIPSSLYIKQTQTYIYIQYENQLRTCNKCGLNGHQIKDCRTKDKDKVNIFDLDCLILDEYDTVDLESNISEEETEVIVENSGIHGSLSTDTGDLESNISEEETEVIVENLGKHGSLSTDTNKNQMSFECTECDYKCDHQSTLDDHMKTHNPNINAEIYMDPTQEVIEYKCTKCDYKCNYEHILIAHMETHTKDKSFACSKCENKYESKEELNMHMVTHTDEKPFKCNKCEYRFSSGAELNLHMKNHTGETLIDASFADIVKSPKKVIKATPKKGSCDNSAISASQPCKSMVEDSTRKTKRGTSLSPGDYYKETARVNSMKKTRSLKKPTGSSKKKN